MDSNPKPSQIIAELDKKYEFTRFSLYEPPSSPEGKCKVCALGGLALEMFPERFIPKKRPSGDYSIWDKETEHFISTYALAYELFPELAGKILNFEYTITDREEGKEDTIRTSSLGHFISRINDYSTEQWKAVQKALEKYGL